MLDQLFQSLPSPSVSVLILIVAYYIISTLRLLNENRKIRSLGARAPIRRTYLPLGLDFVYEAVKYASENRNLAFWEKSFSRGPEDHNYTLEFRTSGQRIIFTADPENIKAILATQFQDYGKGEQFNKDWHDFLGDSIFTTDGERWHNSRQLIRPQFIRDRLSDLDIFERHFQELAPKLGGKGQTVDVADLFFRYTLDAATDFLLGRSVNSLVDPQVRFAKAFGEVQRFQSLIARIGPLHKLLPRRKFREGLKVINEFVNPYIDEALRLSPEELEKRSKSDQGYTFLHALAGYTRDRTVLRDQLVAVLLAGRDTTACTLSWLFHHLSLNPRIVQKLRQEISEHCGTSPPSYAALKNMRYLQHTLNETLRLYPVVPFNVRVALKDTTLPVGGGASGSSPIGILAGTPIGYSTLLLQRRPDLYPPSSATFPPPEVFAPERWDNWTPRSWTYVPFNGGPRICIGQQFALTEMGYVVVRILQRFAGVESREMGEVELQTDIVLQPAGGVRVAFWEGEGEKV
ncbi:hypothetical protein H2201_004663 [Coniosporium apollinis]|uniref:Cytochrome P450 alkane hydroxylase n=1 Tax=Coniosporium apollinis TaxID=61459 RepID=A0ABQ9NS17_9PEZI|nr:hypothetical protein H2201_004663 [Coniosporium apollinis]